MSDVDNVSRGYRVVDNIQMCWGEATLTLNAQNTRVYNFEIKYEKPFAAGTSPALGLNIIGNNPGPGIGFVVYSVNDMNNQHYTGGIIATNNGVISGHPIMTYVAIGLPK